MTRTPQRRHVSTEGVRAGYGEVTKAVLLDTAKLLDWRSRNMGAPAVDGDAIFVLAAATRALEINWEHPERLFVWLVKGNRRSFLTAAQEDYGHELWRKHLGISRPSTAGEYGSNNRPIGDIIAELAKRFATEGSC